MTRGIGLFLFQLSPLEKPMDPASVRGLKLLGMQSLAYIYWVPVLIHKGE